MAERFRFTDDFDYKPNQMVTIGFKKGQEGEIVTAPGVSGKITNAVAEAAIAAKKGEKVGAPAKAPKADA